MPPGPQALHYGRMLSYGLATVEIKLMSDTKKRKLDVCDEAFSTNDDKTGGKTRNGEESFELAICNLARSAGVLSYPKALAS